MFQLYVNVSEKAVKDETGTWSPTHHAGDRDGVSRLLVFTWLVIWGVNQQMCDLCLPRPVTLPIK